MTVTQRQADAAVQRQVYLERFKASEVKRYESFLKKVDKSLRTRLGKSDLTDFGRDRLRSELKQVREILDGIYAEWADEFRGQMLDLAPLEAQYEGAVLDDLTPEGFSFKVPSPSQLRAAVFAQPLSVRGTNGGKLLDPFIKDFTQVQKTQLIGVIRQGYFEGKTNYEIMRTIRGTAANKFRDGVLNISKNHAQAVIRTSVQHVSSVARFETWNNNDDIIDGYRWVATLDLKTTQQCRSLDGQVFKLGKGPKPPIHIGCRSTTIAELRDDLKYIDAGRKRASMSGPVKDESYYNWLKRQPAKFQDDALGATRGALFRRGGLTPDEFAKLNLGRNFEPLTLEQMRALDPLAFKKAKIPA